MTLKIIFYLIIKKTTIMHNIYIYIYTHKNLQLLRWYAMILIYSKSDILLQLHFLWSLNSNLQINKLGAAYKMSTCQLLFKRKDINNHTLYKYQICPRVKSFDTHDVHEIYTIKYSHIYIFNLTFMLFCDWLYNIFVL